VRSRAFTLIELLIVVVIIGILVAVLIPRFANSRDQAFVSAMKSDLRNLATAEESYFYDYATYTPSTGNLTSYNPSMGVTVVINEATRAGWSGTATSSHATRQCFLFIGNAAPVGAATQEGQVACN
jgi:type IV pilus assembly protein PilA